MIELRWRHDPAGKEVTELQYRYKVDGAIMIIGPWTSVKHEESTEQYGEGSPLSEPFIKEIEE